VHTCEDVADRFLLMHFLAVLNTELFEKLKFETIAFLVTVKQRLKNLITPLESEMQTFPAWISQNFLLI
jgi:hypothetical protein